jgi:hypothetical protein
MADANEWSELEAKLAPVTVETVSGVLKVIDDHVATIAREQGVEVAFFVGIKTVLLVLEAFARHPNVPAWAVSLALHGAQSTIGSLSEFLLSKMETRRQAMLQ